MNILIFLIVGLIAGWLAGLIIRGEGYGPILNIGIGIVGAFVGGLVFNSFGVFAYGLWGSIAMAVIGSIFFLFLLGLFSNTRTRV